ncbi:hypothetical protein [Cyclobacterium plantarum]|uniref:hypothetical protein n=1 Tax=Cyclobacterium plantarum TaxID=2716263 RepID=UPI003F729D05
MKNCNQTTERGLFFSIPSISLLVLCLLVSFTSCSTGTDDDIEDKIGDYMISFNGNGVLQEFTADHFPQGNIFDNGTQYTGVFSGTRSSSSVGVSVYDNKAIASNNYSGFVVTEPTQQSLAFVIGASINYNEGQTVYSTPDSNPQVTVTITEITSTEVRGTFSGTLKSSGKEDLVVTNGKFYVPRATNNL